MISDYSRISILTSAVNKLIELGHKEDSLDEDSIYDIIDKALFIVGSGLEFTDEEKSEVVKNITYQYQIKTSPGYSILSDYEQSNWYSDRKSRGELGEEKFWLRYRNYLVDEKHFSPSVVATLGEETLDQKLMNYILDPNIDTDQPLLKRGLIIGDVQSGKTSTYIGFMCKAADAGYKVFILLTGTIESLRRQTQERVEEGFIGIDLSSDDTGGKRVGVGLDNKEIMAMSLTSRTNDFTGNNDKNVISLLNTKNAVVFVIKKNSTTLQKLTKWLVTLNADKLTQKIDLPMLMIDDEADNASINTSKDKEDPTKINKLIRDLANVFTKSNYVGFTATPFANVFIDPEKTENMVNQDLFPEDFIVALPTPSNYIGAEKIFEKSGEYHSQLIYINDAGREEEDGFSFYFLHKKEWRGELPYSLTDSIYTFYLANAIRDLRGDKKAHRSMLINISRFIKVQKYIKEEVDDIHTQAYRSIKFNLSDDFEESMKDPVLKRIHRNWEEQYSNLEFTWDEIADVLLSSIENIQIRVVNSSKNSEKLEYPPNESLRVIAIGGLALSRGLTLEGLVTSYFYRNTSTYDVLMQMGRWFGYRRGYEDIFRIWTHKASADWYGEISEATRLLKADMHTMREYGQKPKDFGIRVRNDSSELSITAYNKMRNATDAFETISYFGGHFETPYLHYSAEKNIQNYNLLSSFVENSVNDGLQFDIEFPDENKGRYVLRGIPKYQIITFLNSMNISRYNTKFDKKQITSFLTNCADSSLDLFDIIFIEGKRSKDNSSVKICGKEIYLTSRNHCKIDSNEDRLSVGRRGKLAGPTDGKAGITDFNGHSRQEIIDRAIEDYKEYYWECNGYPFDETKSMPSDMWFAFIKDRRPALMVYLIDIGFEDDDATQKRQIEQFKNQMCGIPAVGLALGVPKSNNGDKVAMFKYKTNKIYNYFEKDEILADSEGDVE